MTNRSKPLVLNRVGSVGAAIWLTFVVLLATEVKVEGEGQRYAAVWTTALGSETPGKRLQLLLDARLTLSVQEELWGHGDWTFVLSPTSSLYREFTSRPPVNAKLAIVGGDGKPVAERDLEQPLARIEAWAQSCANNQEFLVSVDYSAGFGSYNGPITSLLQVSNWDLHFEEAVDAKSGQHEPIRMMQSLKSAWRIAKRGNQVEILVFGCRPKVAEGKFVDNQFVVEYVRYTFDGTRWLKYKREAPGFWEEDMDFPKRSRFP